MTAALVLLAIGIGGTALGVLMIWRGQLRALALVALFPLLGAAAGWALLHVPTRLVVGGVGIEVTLGVLNDRWGWSEIDTVTLEDGPLGPSIAFIDRREARPAPARLTGRRQRFHLGSIEIDLSDVSTRIGAWRLAAGGR